MMIQRSKAIVAFAVVLCLSMCLVAFADHKAHDAAAQEALNVSLYKVLPAYDYLRKP